MIESIAILQARTSSSRLPGKVLLSVAGMPLVVLAARRAANTGRHVVVVTSEEPSDDALARTLETEGIPCFRGSLSNTLKRVVDALSDYPDDTRVFRLTGDNVFPDGRLLDEMEADYLSQKTAYLYCGGKNSGLPYGVSAELMQLKDLREANCLTDSEFDQEHVTPFIRRKHGEAYFDRYQSLAKYHYRATIDCLDDYFIVRKVFDEVGDALSISFLKLVEQLSSAPLQPFIERPAKKLVLGTAQLGMRYGVANKRGEPSLSLSKLLIKTAISNGVASLDTAQAYGMSESVIGDLMAQGWQGRVDIVTKLSPLDGCPDDATPEVIKAFVDASIYESFSALRVRHLDTLLLHREEHRQKWGGMAWQYLKHLKDQGLIGKLGVSVQSPEELAASLDDPLVEHIQLPFNILDFRWESLITKLEAAKQDREIIVHVRSAMLQGVLPSCNILLWRKIGFDNPQEIMDWLESERQLIGVASIADLCLLYCASQSWADGVVVGVESEEQLNEDIKVFSLLPLSREQIQSIDGRRPRVQDSLLNPSSWKLEKSHE